MALGLPRRLAPVLPTTYSSRYLLLRKAQAMLEHSGFPYHAFAHCKVFATAAPLRARTSISVSFSGQPLSRPLRIFGLVSHYLTNYLIRRRPIFKHPKTLKKRIFQYLFYIWYYPRFPKVIPNLKAGYRRVTEQFAADLLAKISRLACLNRILIAATSRRINGKRA